jgi:hypothetical protein
MQKTLAALYLGLSKRHDRSVFSLLDEAKSMWVFVGYHRYQAVLRLSVLYLPHNSPP